MKSIAFFGHSSIFDKTAVKKNIDKALNNLVLKERLRVLIGCHGDFDQLALSSCLDYKKNNDLDIQIDVVLTSLSFLKKDCFGYSKADFFKQNNCQPIFYDIEEVYFKKRIIFSNKKMVDESDLIICYVDMKAQRSGAKQTISYAIKQNKQIVNLFEGKD